MKAGEFAVRRIQHLNRLIRCDPARRGLTGVGGAGESWLPDDLAPAALDLASRASHVAIVTGFHVPDADPPAAETDGPPGATLLADILQQLGIRASIVTDEPCGSAVISAAQAVGLSADQIIVVTDDSEDGLVGVLEELDAESLTQLVAIERVGPAHSLESLRRQPHADTDVLRRFEKLVGEEHRNRCHNARGECIDHVTLKLHRLFEIASDHLPACRTIGVGDGGNEIGMGSISWNLLVDHIASVAAPTIPSRVPTDWTIVAGTSNWGAWGLAAAVAIIRNRVELLSRWTAERHEHQLLVPC